MNELQIFESNQFGQVRTIFKDNEPWFVAVDVCRALEVGNPSQALSRLDDDEKFTTIISNEGAATGKSSAAFVNEPGLYSLVLGSRKPEAKAFKRWITHEVIPAIRKHGGYLTPEKVEEALLNPDVMIKLLTNLKEERAARIAAEEKTVALEEKVEADAPKVQFANSVTASKQSILVGELAKLLRQNGAPFGQNRLFEKMRADGFLHQTGSRKNMPTQRAIEMGVLELLERTVINSDGSIRLTRTPKVTGKGQVYFINRYGGKHS